MLIIIASIFYALMYMEIFRQTPPIFTLQAQYDFSRYYKIYPHKSFGLAALSID